MIMASVSCTTTNPFLTEWNTPYGIPDFSKVKEKHYVEAVEAGVAQQQAEIDAIIANTDAPTFENVVAECFLNPRADIYISISMGVASRSLGIKSCRKMG